MTGYKEGLDAYAEPFQNAERDLNPRPPLFEKGALIQAELPADLQVSRYHLFGPSTFVGADCQLPGRRRAFKQVAACAPICAPLACEALAADQARPNFATRPPTNRRIGGLEQDNAAAHPGRAWKDHSPGADTKDYRRTSPDFSGWSPPARTAGEDILRSSRYESVWKDEIPAPHGTFEAVPRSIFVGPFRQHGPRRTQTSPHGRFALGVERGKPIAHGS